MWIKLNSEEMDVVLKCLKQCNLHGMMLLLEKQLLKTSPLNFKHKDKNAIKAAQTYFSCNDLIFHDDSYVMWDEEGNAWIMGWQKIDKDFITEEDCNCGKKSG